MTRTRLLDLSMNSLYKGLNVEGDLSEIYFRQGIYLRLLAGAHVFLDDAEKLSDKLYYRATRDAMILQEEYYYEN